MKYSRTEIISGEKLDNQTIQIQYVNGEKENFAIIPISTRDEAIKLAAALTKKALLNPNAFENLGIYLNNYSNLRNYEIEQYIDLLSDTIGHIIIELCPFSGFSVY